MRKIYLAFGFMLIMLLAISTNLMGGTIYVDIDAGGSNNGTSWSDAYTSLQSALSAAASGDEIWVAKGTYKPTTGTDRTSSFQMKNGVEIYGGFAGTESAVDQRTNYGVGEANETILSGDLSDNDDFDVTNYGYQGTTGDDNCYYVIFNPDQDPDIDDTAILDGFTITGGNANGESPHNYGGGMYNYYSDPTVTNCTFTSNSVSEYGGGMYNDSSDPTVTNCTFTSNEAVYGGGMYNYYYSSPTLNNCIVWGNEATYGGGDEIDISGGTTTLNYSCYANEVGDIYNNGGNFTPDGNCITSDPCFVGDVNNPDHPYSISGISPCCDTGYNDYNTQIYDIRGEDFPRKLDKSTGGAGTIDMGAYEYKVGVDPSLPIILSTFTAQYLNDTPTLCWTTQSETNNAGWNIYRSESDIFEEASQINTELIPGAGSTSEPTDYVYVDENEVVSNTEYWYWLESVDYSGDTESYGPITLLIPEDEEEPGSPEIPGIYGLHQNYPNPFNPSTEISFMMKESCVAELAIYNIKGEKIATLFQNKSVAKDELIRTNWDGKDDFGKAVSSGTYFYKLRTNKEDFVRKMVLMK